MYSIKKLFVLTLFLVSVSVLPALAAGEIDPSFNPSVVRVPGTTEYLLKIQTSTVQPDGKILVGGYFGSVNGAAKSMIARLNPDGSIDNTFNPPDIRRIFDPPYNLEILPSVVYSIKLQSNGKIIIGGYFSYHDGVPRGAIARLNADGSFDPTFNTPPRGGTIYDLEVQPDDKIILASDNGQAYYVARLNADGTVDNTFQADQVPNVNLNIALLPDGKLLVAGYDSSNPLNSSFLRLNTNGSIDNTFNIGTINNGYIKTVKVQADGKILIGGTFTGINGFASSRMARLLADGSLDVSFGTTGSGAAGGDVEDVDIDSNGKILIAGGFTFFNGDTNRKKITRLNSDGTNDATFSFTQALFGPALDITSLPGGKIFAGGSFFTSYTTPTSPNQPLFLNSDGTIDNSSSGYIGNGGLIRTIVVQPDGKVLVGGRFSLAGGAVRHNIARFNADGTIDTSFVPVISTAIPQITGFVVNALVVQPDGKILVGSGSGAFALSRLNADGSPDTSFSSNFESSSTMNDIALQPDGKIIAGGAFRKMFDINRVVARFNVDGTLDNTFNPGTPSQYVGRVVLQGDGKVLIGGNFTAIGPTPRGRIARLNPDGSLDASFNPPGGANAPVEDIEVQADGKIVLVGQFTALNGSNTRKYVGRLNLDGTLDTGFAQEASWVLSRVEIQPDGKILVGGTMRSIGGISRTGIARLNSDGSVDSGFQVGTGTNYPVYAIARQADGKILVGGEFTRFNGASKVGIARLLNAAVPIRPLFDYDGDGKADVSVYRPSTNRWYVFKSSDSTVTETTFGIAGDVPVPADFDGDGKTDIAIFRPSSGDWWSLSSINGAQIFAHWGASGDIPRPSDFDGDGRADYVVFRPSDNFWYRISSANGASSNGAFGLTGDKPVTGDFDGDGKSDKAIFRPSTGDWWYQSSINGAQLAVHWGISTDVPAPADFDGDGKTDFAVYRPSTGVWYVINSSNGSFLIMAFGIAEDKPVPADYDGDGKADIAVFRPSTGTWYQMKTTAGFAAQQFGISTDIPTENAFVP